MSSILKHLFRNTIEKKLRTFIFVVTIVFATAVLFIGLSLNTIMNDTYQTMIQGAFGNANVVVTKNVHDEDSLYVSDEVDVSYHSVKQVNHFIEATGTSFLDGDDVTVSLIGMDLDKAVSMQLIAPFTYEEEYEIDGNRVMISHQIATKYDLSVGDEIEVTMNEEEHLIRIGAISQTSGIFYAGIDDLLAVTEPTFVQSIYKKEEYFSRTFLTVHHEHIDEAIDQLATANKGFSIQKANHVMTTNRDEETFQITMVTAITIIVLISAYVILSLTKMIVVERMPVVGTFRSIGTSKRLMNRILALEFFIYGLAGAVLGLLLAFFLLPPIADVFNEYKDVGVATEVTYSLQYAMIATLFGMLFPVCVGMIHIVRSNHKPLKDIILQTKQTEQTQSVISMIVGVCLLISSLIFHWMNPMDQMAYAVLSVLCLIVALIVLVPTLLSIISFVLSKVTGRSRHGELIVGIKNISNNKTIANNSSMIIIVVILLLMVGTTTKSLDQYLAGAIKKDYDIVMEQLEEDPSFYEDIDSIDGVETIRGDYVDVADYYIKGNTGEFSVIGVDDIEAFDRDLTGIVFGDGAKERMKREPEGILIDQYQAKRFGLDIGDTITLQPYDEQGQSTGGEGEDLEVAISGLINSYGNGPGRVTALVHLDFFNEHFHGTYNQIGITVMEGYDEDDVKNEVSSLYRDSSGVIVTFDKKLAGQVESIDTLMIGITLIILLGMIIGILGITNNLIVAFLQRKKEFAVLYSVCMSRRQLVKMQLYEMLTTFIAVTLIGWGGGMLTNVVLKKLLYAIELRVELSFNYGLFGILCVGIFVILLLSSFATVRKVTQMNMLRELRYE